MANGRELQLEEDETCVQVEWVRGTLDVVTRLAGEPKLEGGISAGSQLAAGRSYPSVSPLLAALDGAAIQKDWSLSSPGSVVT